MHGNITITLRVTPQRAIMIYNRLYACGELPRDKWLQNITKIKSQEKIHKKMQQKNRKKSRLFIKILKKTRSDAGFRF